MYCKIIKKPRTQKYRDIFPNPDYVKVLAIIHYNGKRPNRVVLQANWAGCINPNRAYKNEINYIDPSIKNDEKITPNAYWLDYDEVEIIKTYDNNRSAAVILEEEY